MGRKQINQWERIAYLWHKTGVSLREIKLVLKERGLDVSHETIRTAIKKMGEEMKRPI